MNFIKFKINTEDLKDLIPSMGYGFVSNKIVIDGEKVNFMYRDTREEKEDSGWRFLSGTESQDYIDNDNNSMIFDLNTIANYDEAIIPYLKRKTGTELERIEGTDEFK